MIDSTDSFAIPNTVLRHFDLASPPWAYGAESEYELRRSEYPEGKLFFDRLLAAGDAGIDGPLLYPPTSPAAIRRLLHTICVSATLDRLKQDCYLYYLLKDYDARPQVETQGEGGMDVDGDDGVVIVKSTGAGSKAERFATQRCMPKKWRAFVDGYWALDNGKWELAVTSLSNASISAVNFVPEIIQTLGTIVSPPSFACRLLHTLITSLRPDLSENADEADICLVATASAGSLLEAFNIIRVEELPEVRARMRQVIWCWMLGAPRSPCGSGAHSMQPKVLKQLVHLPLTPEEQDHLIDFLSHPPRTVSAPALSQLHDLVTLRLIHQGQFQQTLQLDKQLAGSGGKQEDKQRRRDMVREFVSILPEAHRRVLLGNVEAARKEEGAEVNGFREEDNMAGSWVKVNGAAPAQSAPPAPAPTAATSTAPAPSRPAEETPLRPSGSSSSLFALSRAGGASPTKPQERHNSPFGGPPRFASGSANFDSPANPSPRRVFSGSPFNAPVQAAARAAVPSPKPVVVINDDEEEAEALKRGSVLGKGKSKGKGTMRRSTRQISMSLEPEMEIEVDENHPIEPIAEDVAWSPAPQAQPEKVETDVEPEPEVEEARPEPPRSTRRQTKRVASGASQRETTPPLPTSPPRRSTRARQSVMPGAFNSTDTVIDDAPPARRTRAASATPAPPSVPRSRMTRSVSRALADPDFDELPPPPTPGLPAKRNGAGVPGSAVRKKRRGSVAASEVTDEGSVFGDAPRTGTRRSTRARAGTEDRGSPTPSVAGSEVGKRRSTRALKDGSATPRMSTRTRRA
ncbi:hypothetical protein IAT38_000496 [Cryptococcus sp. DSM 104549]